MSDVLTPNEEAALEELIWELSTPHTLQEIAARLGCRFQLVSQIEHRALRKMRESLKAKGTCETDWL